MSENARTSTGVRIPFWSFQIASAGAHVFAFGGLFTGPEAALRGKSRSLYFNDGNTPILCLEWCFFVKMKKAKPDFFAGGQAWLLALPADGSNTPIPKSRQHKSVEKHLPDGSAL